ncbi:hypothetical protein ASF79_16160 [Agreia sp. Leaf335]|nr:hypothetical protein ASE64_15035 [Agreia sp. Leaf210]KQR19197.1 hypothetical protein ASF79_16160 [Agreia sp. Leaf335]
MSVCSDSVSVEDQGAAKRLAEGRNEEMEYQGSQWGARGCGRSSTCGTFAYVHTVRPAERCP